MSKLITETEDYLEIEQYLHRDSDSYSNWLFDMQSNLRYPDKIVEAEHYALYEIKIIYRIDKKTAEVTYISLT